MVIPRVGVRYPSSLRKATNAFGSTPLPEAPKPQGGFSSFAAQRAAAKMTPAPAPATGASPNKLPEDADPIKHILAIPYASTNNRLGGNVEYPDNDFLNADEKDNRYWAQTRAHLDRHGLHHDNVDYALDGPSHLAGTLRVLRRFHPDDPHVLDRPLRWRNATNTGDTDQRGDIDRLHDHAYLGLTDKDIDAATMHEHAWAPNSEYQREIRSYPLRQYLDRHGEINPQEAAGYSHEGPTRPMYNVSLGRPLAPHQVMTPEPRDDTKPFGSANDYLRRTGNRMVRDWGIDLPESLHAYNQRPLQDQEEEAEAWRPDQGTYKGPDGKWHAGDWKDILGPTQRVTKSVQTPQSIMKAGVPKPPAVSYAPGMIHGATGQPINDQGYITAHTVAPQAYADTWTTDKSRPATLGRENGAQRYTYAPPTTAPPRGSRHLVVHLDPRAIDAGRYGALRHGEGYLDVPATTDAKGTARRAPLDARTGLPTDKKGNITLYRNVEKELLGQKHLVHYPREGTFDIKKFRHLPDETGQVQFAADPIEENAPPGMHPQSFKFTPDDIARLLDAGTVTRDKKGRATYALPVGQGKNAFDTEIGETDSRTGLPIGRNVHGGGQQLTMNVHIPNEHYERAMEENDLPWEAYGAPDKNGVQQKGRLHFTDDVDQEDGGSPDSHLTNHMTARMHVDPTALQFVSKDENGVGHYEMRTDQRIKTDKKTGEPYDTLRDVSFDVAGLHKDVKPNPSDATTPAFRQTAAQINDAVTEAAPNMPNPPAPIEKVGAGKDHAVQATATASFVNNVRARDLAIATHRAPAALALPLSKDQYRDAIGVLLGDDKKVGAFPDTVAKWVQDPMILRNYLMNQPDSVKQGWREGCHHAYLNSLRARSGKMMPEEIARTFVWTILSRGASPFPHESAAADLEKSGILHFVQHSIAGTFDANVRKEYGIWLSKGAAGVLVHNAVDKGLYTTDDERHAGLTRNSPGTAVSHTVNAVGRMLQNLNGKWDDLHAQISDPKKGAEDVAEYWWGNGYGGAGVDNKILNFALAMLGKRDTSVIDIIQSRELHKEAYEHMLSKGYQKGQAQGAIAKYYNGVHGMAHYRVINNMLRGTLDALNNDKELRDFVGHDLDVFDLHYMTWVSATGRAVPHQTAQLAGASSAQGLTGIPTEDEFARRPWDVKKNPTAAEVIAGRGRQTVMDDRQDQGSYQRTYQQPHPSRAVEPEAMEQYYPRLSMQDERGDVEKRDAAMRSVMPDVRKYAREQGFGTTYEGTPNGYQLAFSHPTMAPDEMLGHVDRMGREIGQHIGAQSFHTHVITTPDDPEAKPGYDIHMLGTPSPQKFGALSARLRSTLPPGVGFAILTNGTVRLFDLTGHAQLSGGVESALGAIERQGIPLAGADEVNPIYWRGTYGQFGQEEGGGEEADRRLPHPAERAQGAPDGVPAEGVQEGDGAGSVAHLRSRLKEAQEGLRRAGVPRRRPLVKGIGERRTLSFPPGHSDFVGALPDRHYPGNGEKRLAARTSPQPPGHNAFLGAVPTGDAYSAPRTAPRVGVRATPTAKSDEEDAGDPYIKLPVIVHAKRVTKRTAIKTPEGTVTADCGDMKVTGNHKDNWPIKGKIFADTYVPYDEKRDKKRVARFTREMRVRKAGIPVPKAPAPVFPVAHMTNWNNSPDGAGAHIDDIRTNGLRPVIGSGGTRMYTANRQHPTSWYGTPLADHLVHSMTNNGYTPATPLDDDTTNSTAPREHYANAVYAGLRGKHLRGTRVGDEDYPMMDEDMYSKRERAQLWRESAPEARDWMANIPQPDPRDGYTQRNEVVVPHSVGSEHLLFGKDVLDRLPRGATVNDYHRALAREMKDRWGYDAPVDAAHEFAALPQKEREARAHDLIRQREGEGW